MESTFIDYFLVCGIDVTTGLELEQYASKVQGLANATPLERPYIAKILNHYPEIREGQPFTEEILPLCLPKGLRFCTQKDVPMEPAFHSFACIRADGSRVDGCALTFWEEVVHPHIIQSMQSLHSMHLRELTGGGPAITISGASVNGDGENSGGQRMDESMAVSSAGRGGGSHTLPRRGRSHKSKRTSFYDASKDKLFVCKCMAMILRLPMVGACESVLRALYSFISGLKQPPLPLESYVYWLLYEVPLPPPGRSLKLTLAQIDIVCQRPGVNELPFFDYSLRQVFDLLPVDKFLKIYTCVLLEQQILLRSKVLQRLMLVAETLTSLLFPFRWEHVYVPILPYSQAMFLEAPLPFIMGIWYNENIPEDAIQSNICLVDIDTGCVGLPEDMPALPDRQELEQELFFVFDRYLERENMYERAAMHNASGSKTKGSDQQWKRMSRSFDDDSLVVNLGGGGPSGVDSNGAYTGVQHRRPPQRSQLPPLPLDVLKESAPLARITALARKAGVDVTLENLQQELESSAAYRDSPSCRRYFEEMRFNNAIREIFVNRFVYMLFSYDHFIIGSYGDKETFVSNRESMQNFDKTSFLSDQPESHLPFLSAFLETQMFTSFIDNKILSQWETPDPFLDLFDRRLIELRERYGDAMVRTPTYEVCPSVAFTEEMIAKREESFDYEVPRPHALDGLIDSPDSAEEQGRVHQPGFFPQLDANVLNRPPPASPQRSPWKQRYRHLRQKEHNANDRFIGDMGKSYRNSANLSGFANDLTPAQVAQTNWKFVEQLLRDAKAKTKRLLVEKMGKEAVQLGHGLSITGVEENTLVASLCDLVERIWSHGLHKKKGKSALWIHLLALQELEKASEEGKPIPPAYLTPDSSKQQQQLPHPLVVYFQNLQKDITYPASGKQDPVPNVDAASVDSNGMNDRAAAGGQWSTNLLKAASFICDKLQQQTAAFTGSTPELNVCEQTDAPNYRWKRRGFRDFSPWSSNMSNASSNSSIYSASAAVSPSTPIASGGNQYDSNGAFNNTAATTSTTEQYEPSSPRKRSLSRPRSPETTTGSLKPLPSVIAYDMRNVLKMTEIKTDIGFARAFVRLALERKLLHKHLKALLSNQDLLRSLYKRYAFLRCEEEKEQFLFHILSLHAVDFHCFTNTFTKTKMVYQVVIVPGGGRFTIGATVQPSLSIRVAGTCGQTGIIAVPRNALQFTFEHKNLGVLSTLRIGHELVSGVAQPSKWLMEYALIRNEITGRAYKFNCGRWFGRGVDDGSLERLLVAEPITLHNGTPDSSSSSSKPGWRTPPRSRSPSTHRKGSIERMTPRSRVSEVEQLLGEAVNNIVKSFYQCDRDKSTLTVLLCGDRGLVWCMEQAFLVGFRTSRLFRQSYPWDFIEKFALYCATCLRENASSESKDNKTVMAHCCRLVARINANTNVGKDGKFQVFILISLQKHYLPALIILMARSPVAQTMYDEPSFFKTPRYRLFLAQLLASLNEFTFDLEKSLTWGIQTFSMLRMPTVRRVMQDGNSKEVETLHIPNGPASGQTRPPATSASQDPANTATMAQRVFSALFFAVSSASAMFINKIVLTNYRFPSYLFLGIGQMIAILLVLLTASIIGIVKLPRCSISTVKKIFPLPLFYVLNLFSGLGGTKKLNLPMFTVLRRFSILMTMIGEFWVFGIVPRFAVQFAVGLMILGSFVAALDDLAFDAFGYLMITLNNFGTAANGVCLKRKLDAKGLGKNGLQFYNALLMLPFALVLAVVNGDLEKVYEYNRWRDPWFMTVFSLACLCGFVLNYATVLCTNYNSALVTACVGTIKNLFVTYGGMISSGDYFFSMLNFVGINISVLGSIIYTFATFTGIRSRS